MALHVTVCSPVIGQSSEKFIWNCKLDDGHHNDNLEIIDTVKWIVVEISELSGDKDIQGAFRCLDTGKFTSVKHLCDVYNKKISALHQTWNAEKANKISPRASTLHLKHIISQCYNRAVEDPDVLNKYEAFSPEVYGETSYELVDQMISGINFTDNDAFIDLGSGVGQVVLQVAAATNIKRCIGIEKADMPAKYAREMETQFRKWMAFYGKSYQEFELRHDDFLSEQNRDLIIHSSIIFVNNFAFGPKVDHELKERFSHLKEGARIVSSKVFCPLNFRITDRNLGDIGSILSVRTMSPLESAVSWTDTPFCYHLHTVDFSLLENYFASLKNPELKQSLAVRRDRQGRPLKLNSFKDSSRVIGDASCAASTVSTSRQSSQLDLTDLLASSNDETATSMDMESNGDAKRQKLTSAISETVAKIQRRERKKRENQEQNGGAEGVGHRDLNRNNIALLHSTTVRSYTEPSFDSTPYNLPSLSSYHDTYISRGERTFHTLDSVLAANDLKDTAFKFDREVEMMTPDDDVEEFLSSLRVVLMSYKLQARQNGYKKFVLQKVKEAREENARLRETMVAMQRQVLVLQEEGMAVLRRRLGELGIKAEKPSQFFQASRKAIRIRNDLNNQRDQLKKEVDQLEARSKLMAPSPDHQSHDPMRPPTTGGPNISSLLDSHLTEMIRNALNSDQPAYQQGPSYSPISNGGNSEDVTTLSTSNLMWSKSNASPSVSAASFSSS